MCTRAAHRADCFLARLLHEQAARKQEMRLLILRLLVPHVLTYTSPRIVLRPLALHFSNARTICSALMHSGYTDRTVEMTRRIEKMVLVASVDV